MKHRHCQHETHLAALPLSGGVASSLTRHETTPPAGRQKQVLTFCHPIGSAHGSAMTLVLERHSRRCQPTLVTLATAYAPIVDRCRVNTYSPLSTWKCRCRTSKSWFATSNANVETLILWLSFSLSVSLFLSSCLSSLFYNYSHVYYWYSYVCFLFEVFLLTRCSSCVLVVF